MGPKNDKEPHNQTLEIVVTILFFLEKQNK